MQKFKRNQVEQAIFLTYQATGARVKELRYRIKRLLMTDRKASEGTRPRSLFFSSPPPGSGTEVLFSEFEAFALLAAVMLLEHGLPQLTAVNILRSVRTALETAYAPILKENTRSNFDAGAIAAQAKPGALAVSTTDPLFLVFATARNLTVAPPSLNAAICRGEIELNRYVKTAGAAGGGVTIFELAVLIHAFSANLSRTTPAKRGRASS
jgi:hypothetical protein